MNFHFRGYTIAPVQSELNLMKYVAKKYLQPYLLVSSKGQEINHKHNLKK